MTSVEELWETKRKHNSARKYKNLLIHSKRDRYFENKFNSYRFHIYIYSCIYEKFGDILPPFFGSPMKSSLQKNNPNVHESDYFINLVYHM